MKKVFLVIITVTIAAIVFLPKKHSSIEETSEHLAPSSTTLCFIRSVVPTVDAPYKVDEEINLTLTTYNGETKVVGTKSGNQAGPDMMNGYTGTLEGILKEGTLSLLYSYTIEGSQQAEQEEYTFEGENLVKHRYPLIEKDGILIPDKSKDVSLQVYLSSNTCD